MQTIRQTAKPFDILLKKQKVKLGQQYRPMYYVVEQPVEEGLLLYHTMTKALILLNHQEADVYHTHPIDIPQLIEEWFIVPESHDDRLLSRQIRNVAKMLKKKADAITNYTIMTTTDCNARCFYCYEMGRSRIPMRLDTALQTADYIIRHCQGKKVSIQWFGGEPLYNKPVITLICQKLKDACISYQSTMVSNGYLFDENTIKEAKEEWFLHEVQITLDGTEKIYNHSKAYIYKGVNAYYRVIKNIHSLQNAGIHVCIRLNIDIYNADNLLELTDELKHEFSSPKGISVYIHPLLEVANGSQAMHNKQKRIIIFNKVAEIEARLRDYGFIRANRLRHSIKTNKCMADNDNSIIIAPDGNIGKCEHYTDDHFIGHIGSQNIDNILKSIFLETHDEIDACATCFNYPDCIWLKICQNKTFCYQEDINHELALLRQSIVRVYKEEYKEK